MRESPGSEEGNSTVEGLLGDRQLVAVSNREPYEHEYDDGEVAVSRPAGGLTAALDPVLRSLGGTWIAWGSGSADRDVVDANDQVTVPPEDSAYDLGRVWIDEDDLEGYYYGFSNQVLWPLCHSFPSKVEYDPQFWGDYRAVNATSPTRSPTPSRTTTPSSGSRTITSGSRRGWSASASATGRLSPTSGTSRGHPSTSSGGVPTARNCWAAPWRTTCSAFTRTSTVSSSAAAPRNCSARSTIPKLASSSTRGRRRPSPAARASHTRALKSIVGSTDTGDWLSTFFAPITTEAGTALVEVTSSDD